MNHDKSPIDQALNLVLFGPLGMVLAAKDALPGWVHKGRHRVLHHVEVARLVGEHATRHGQRLVTRNLVDLGIVAGPPPPPSRMAEPATSTVYSAHPGDEAPPSAGSVNGRTAGRRAPLTTEELGAVPASAALAIPGYDSLSASQVVQRLAGLAPSELEAVRVYEAGGRGRRTVLTRVTQLQTGRV